MDLFEILLIAFFVLIPVMEGVLRKNRTGTPPGGAGPRPPRPGPGPGTGWGGPARGGPARERPDRSGAGGPGATPGRAADMVPEDLWELLTGERRRPAPGPVETLPESSTAGGEGDRWSAEPAWGRDPEAAPPPAPEPVPWMEAPGPAAPAPVEPEPSWPEPVSLEYMGPEAYSLEQPLPSPEVRHARFHEKIEASRRGPRLSSPDPLIRSLARPSGLRDAVVLSEILGPPKGLQ